MSDTVIRVSRAEAEQYKAQIGQVVELVVHGTAISRCLIDSVVTLDENYEGPVPGIVCLTRMKADECNERTCPHGKVVANDPTPPEEGTP